MTSAPQVRRERHDQLVEPKLVAADERSEFPIRYRYWQTKEVGFPGLSGGVEVFDIHH